LEEAYSQHFSSLRECQSSYRLKGQFVICVEYTWGIDRLYFLVSLERTPPTKWLINFLNTDYLISLSSPVAAWK